MKSNKKWKNLPVVVAALITILAAPLIGLTAAGEAVYPYLSFPTASIKLTHLPSQQSLSLVATIAALAVLAVAGSRFFRFQPRRAPVLNLGSIVPLTLSLGAVALFWHLAWTRYPWFSPLQEHTFFPLWLSYILVVTSLTRILHSSALPSGGLIRFVALFSLSALFWWCFEYLNRFVQNWVYLLPRDYSPAEYALVASVSFSTVLPAVYQTKRLLATLLQVKTPITNLHIGYPTALFLLTISLATLLLLPILPQLLFPFVWLSPALLFLSLKAVIYRNAGKLVVSLQSLLIWAFAAIACGFFWELWNYYSLSKWIYQVPLLASYRLFEMPLPGYLGYLPFGLECALAVGILYRDSLLTEEEI